MMHTFTYPAARGHVPASLSRWGTVPSRVPVSVVVARSERKVCSFCERELDLGRTYQTDPSECSHVQTGAAHGQR
eukprot:3148518-Prymnesium_polylepis.1